MLEQDSTIALISVLYTVLEDDVNRKTGEARFKPNKAESKNNSDTGISPKGNNEELVQLVDSSKAENRMLRQNHQR